MLQLCVRFVRRLWIQSKFSTSLLLLDHLNYLESAKITAQSIFLQLVEHYMVLSHENCWNAFEQSPEDLDHALLGFLSDILEIKDMTFQNLTLTESRVKRFSDEFSLQTALKWFLIVSFTNDSYINCISAFRVFLTNKLLVRFDTFRDFNPWESTLVD